jgi:hypothetical protein
VIAKAQASCFRREFARERAGMSSSLFTEIRIREDWLDVPPRVLHAAARTQSPGSERSQLRRFLAVRHGDASR